ncbi:MAG: 30S ribosomal protein S17 [Gemmatimonadetes bacterium]|nr:30S ribosomal protein S17 [Gemmatimonadota bacterium]
MDRSEAGLESADRPETAEGTPPRRARKVRQGMVVSDRMDKTIVVSLQTTVEHPLYKKRLRRTTRIKAHDAENTCRIGDRVEVMETRPLSREKRWRLVSVLERAK